MVSRRISIFIPCLLLFCLMTTCSKNKDYRDAFLGTYYCDYVKDYQTFIETPDTFFYMHSYYYDSNVVFSVTRADDPEELLILGVPIKVQENGELEAYFVAGRAIGGRFYQEDSMEIFQGIGKDEGTLETWKGKK